MAASITKFELFPKLPPEMRLEIWSYVHPGPRIVELRWKQLKRTKKWGYACNKSPPLLLHICQETRKEALKSYTFQLKSDRQRYPIFIDPLRDLLYVNGTSQVSPKLFRVRHLAVEGCVGLSSLEGRIWIDISAFKCLETLTIVLHGRNCNVNRHFSRNTDQRLSFASSYIGDVGVAGEFEDDLKLGPSENRSIDREERDGNKVLDRMKEENSDWKKPRLRVAGLGVGQRRCCKIDDYSVVGQLRAQGARMMRMGRGQSFKS
jgi:hypothetical protein